MLIFCSRFDLLIIIHKMDRHHAIDNVQQNFEDHEELEILAEEIAELTNRIAELDEDGDSDKNLDDERSSLENELDEKTREFSELSGIHSADVHYNLGRCPK